MQGSRCRDPKNAKSRLGSPSRSDLLRAVAVAQTNGAVVPSQSPGQEGPDRPHVRPSRSNRCPRWTRLIPGGNTPLSPQHNETPAAGVCATATAQTSSPAHTAGPATKQEHALVALAANPLTRTRAWPTGRSKSQTGRHAWGRLIGFARHRAAPRRPSARPVHGPAGASRETVAAMHGMTSKGPLCELAMDEQREVPELVGRCRGSERPGGA